MRYLFSTILILLVESLMSQTMLMTNNSHRLSGDNSEVCFQFENEAFENQNLRLVVFHNFGISTETSLVKDCLVSFALPTWLTDQSGEYSLRIYKEKNLITSKSVTIIADTTQTPLIEAFSGPKQILTGGNDHTALISTTLDSSDNPWPKGTPTRFDYVFKDQIKTKYRHSKSIYAYERFFSDNQAGNPVVSAQSKGGTHQEFELTLYPNFPENFIISVERDHHYADGKQISEINTSVIRDRFGNIVSDGTIVNFNIQSHNDFFQKGASQTVNGIATMKIPAPSLPMVWQIEAHIDQFAISNIAEVDYKKAISPFSVRLIETKEVEIGPIKSFVGQLVPDHTLVEIDIYQDGKLHKNLKVFTTNGVAKADLDILNLEPCTYELSVLCGGENNRTIVSNYVQK